MLIAAVDTRIACCNKETTAFPYTTYLRVSRTALRTHIDDVPVQHELVSPCNGHCSCLLSGRKWFSVYFLDDFYIMYFPSNYVMFTKNPDRGHPVVCVLTIIFIKFVKHYSIYIFI